MSHHHLSRRRFLTVSAMAAATMALDWSNVSAKAASIPNKSDFPVVVIGAGLGGLCAAACLAQAGFPVTVVEQHSIPGGYATTFDRDNGRFSFEVSLHGTALVDTSTGDLLKHLGVHDRLDWTPLPEVYRLKAPGVDLTVPQKNPEKYIQLLSDAFPEDADGIRAFVTDMLALHDEVDRFSRKKWFFKPIFPLQFRRMWRVRNRSLADLLSEHVQSPEARGAIGALWGYYGLPPAQLSGFYYANATGGYLKHGSYTIRGQSQALSDAMADSIEAAGGTMMYDTAVNKIALDGKAVSGVTLSDGKRLPARLVVSNASAPTTLTQMVPKTALPADYATRLAGLHPSLSSFIVWLGLDGPLESDIPNANIYVSETLDLEENYRRCQSGQIENGAFAVSVHDNAVPDPTAPGARTVMLLFLCRYSPWQKFETAYRNGDKAAYRQEKQRWADILIQRAEHHVLPGLRKRIAVQEIATPLTNWRYTGNPEGAIYGFDQSLDNAFMKRIDNRTPIDGLYLASAWGSPGGGFVGALRGGESAFKKIMEDIT